ncbi:uncharacterized protein EV422DRAFT_569152 [Fimicolochytrium jonesii]|uniref:uncharacterized protein n=1 Tax=Fimicolochytrium jonesii TaxID=1396493 RepID=UPI0022FEB550|nr:uncharacterized protein EV422DRAFT_569152 [Fimicolochytrium jonesii]KAI8818878.1 hypothetical protein EV422DRAFT_569152 [Fimicolochytrium jonesii]
MTTVAARWRPTAILLPFVVLFCFLCLILLRYDLPSTDFTKNNSSPTLNLPSPTNSHLCVLARTYPKQYTYLPAFLLSVVKGTDHSAPLDTTVVVVVTEETTREQKKVLRDTLRVTEEAAMVGGHPRPKIVTLDVRKEEAERVYPLLKDGWSDYGYAYTDVAIEKLAAAHSSPHTTFPKCDYIMFTNADNLYSSRLGTHITPHITSQTDLIGFDMISGHAWHSRSAADPAQGIYDDATMKHLTVAFKTAAIDLGASIHRFDLVVKHGFRFLKIAGVTEGMEGEEAKAKLWNADGNFIEASKAVAQKTAIIRQTLFVHQ